MSIPEVDRAEKASLLGQAVLAATDALEDAQDELCRLDSVAGDGDEGLGIARGARAVRERLNSHRPKEVYDVVEIAASELSAIGGAMGALSYVALSAIGEELQAHGASELSAGRLVQLLAVAEAAIGDFGGAKRGDKSVLDSIAGARDAAERSARVGASAMEALQAAAEGARRGAEATANMEARVGRASRLGARSMGAVDAGAQTFAIILRCLAEVYASHMLGRQRDC